MAFYKKRKIKTKSCQWCGKPFNTLTDKNYCCRECAALAARDRGEQKDTLCWDCGKATGKEDCPWANKFKPVKGWTATPTTIKGGERGSVCEKEISSYNVHKCPLFIEG